MKEGLKVITWLTVIVLLVGAGLYSLSAVTERKDSYSKYEDFHEQEADFDVLFIGQSHVLNGIYPMELWNDFGIVSYNFGGHGNRMATTYWVMQNALEHTTPELIVVDCHMLSIDEKAGQPEQVHLSLDHFPLSETKAAAIQDLFSDSDTQWEFLWKFSTYHNRWSCLTAEDYTPVFNIEKGAESRIGVAQPVRTKYLDPSEKTKGNPLGIQYLEKLIEYCKTNDIELLLTYLPFPDNTGWQEESHRVIDIAKKHKVDFLSYNNLMEIVNNNTDFYDPDSHMNPSGARKITHYIGEYIMEHYEIKDRRNNPMYANWHDDYQIYTQFKYQNLKEQTDLKNYLMLLYDKNVSYGICIPKNPSIILNHAHAKLMENIGIDPSTLSLIEDSLLFVNNKENAVISVAAGETIQTEYGILALEQNEEDKNDRNINILLDDEKLFSDDAFQTDISIVVFDHETGEIVDTAQFVSGMRIE